MYVSRILYIFDAFSVIADRCIKYGNRALVSIEAREDIADADVFIAD